MARPAYGLERRPLEFTPTPSSYVLIAVCLGLGGVCFSIGLFLGLGELFFSLKRLVLEAIFISKSTLAG